MNRKQTKIPSSRKPEYRKSKKDDPAKLQSKPVFCRRPNVDTPAKELSPKQRELIRIVRETVSLNGDDIGKYRTVTQFIRKNRENLNKTENKLLVAGGICKSAASEIVCIAIHSDNKNFEDWINGVFGFRIALQRAKASKALDSATKSKNGKRSKECANYHLMGPMVG